MTMLRLPVRPAGTVALLCAIFVASASGCAWRMNGNEHYLGPVLFRYRVADESGVVNQIVRPGVSIEGGAQWGVSAGVTDRLIAAPWRAQSAGAESSPAPSPKWTTFLNPLGPPGEGRWNVSLLYLRVDALPSATLVLRRAYGAEVTAGDEATALSVGWTTRSLIRPPADALSMIRFDSRRPMETVLMTWPESTVLALDAWNSFKEVQP